MSAQSPKDTKRQHPSPDSLLTLLPSRQIQCEFLSKCLLMYDQTMEQLLSSDCQTIPFSLSVQFFINSPLILYQILLDLWDSEQSEKSRPTGVFRINTTFSPLAIFDPQHTDGRVSELAVATFCRNKMDEMHFTDITNSWLFPSFFVKWSHALDQFFFHTMTLWSSSVDT